MAWDWFPTPPLAAALGYVHVGKVRVNKRKDNKTLLKIKIDPTKD